MPFHPGSDSCPYIRAIHSISSIYDVQHYFGLGLFLLRELRQKRAEQTIVGVQLTPDAAEKFEAVRIGLDDVLRPDCSRLTDQRRAAPFLLEFVLVYDEIVPAF